MLLARPFVFMRHGETELNQERRIGGCTDSPLTALGVSQAREAEVWLDYPWSHVATSTLQRAWHTAELAVPGQLACRYPGLNERDWGELERMPLRQQPPYLTTPPGGETWEAFQARVLAELNGLLMHHHRPLVIAHSGVFRVIRTQLLGQPDGPRLPNAMPLVLQPGLLGWQLHRFMA
jgi:probable phosphoglycerate mutase